MVTPSVDTSPSLTAGQTGFSLDCDVSGTDNLNSPTFTYQWRMDGRALSGQQGRTLTLSPLAASHAGQYTCQVTVVSSSLSSDITVTSNTQTVNIQCKWPLSYSHSYIVHGCCYLYSMEAEKCTFLGPLPTEFEFVVGDGRRPSATVGDQMIAERTVVFF